MSLDEDSGSRVAGREGLPTRSALCDHWRHAARCPPGTFLLWGQGKDLPPKLVLLLYSLSLQVKSPSNQFPKLDSSSDSPLIDLRRHV